MAKMSVNKMFTRYTSNLTYFNCLQNHECKLKIVVSALITFNNGNYLEYIFNIFYFIICR